MRWAILFFLSVILMLFPAVAEEEWSHDELRLIVRNIDNEPGISPEQQFSRLEHYIEHSKTRGWKDIEVLAFSQLANTHINLQQLDEAQAIVDKYQPVAERLKDTKSLLIFLSVRLAVFDVRNDAENAAKIRKQYEAQALAFGEPEEIGYMYAEVAMSLQYFDDLRQSLVNVQKALVIFEKLDHQSGKALTLNSIGSIYNLLGDHRQAIEYNKRALAIYLLVGNKLTISVLYYNMGTSYYNLQQLTQAKELLTKALNLSTELKDDIGIAYAHRNLARVAVEQKAYDDAQVHFFKALSIFERFKDNRMLLETSLGLAKVLSKLERLDEAVDTLTPQAEIANSQSQKGVVVEYYQLLYSLEKKRKNFVAALTALERAEKEKQAIYEKEKEDSLQELIVKFEANQIEADNKLLQHQNELQQLRLTEQESQHTILILAFSFVIMAAAFITILLFKQVQNRNLFKIMALRDELTGAPNRRAIMAYGNKMFDQCQEDGSRLTIAMLDIDDFKCFNDNYGHAIGDLVLKVFSEACHESIRGHDHYGRFGGEEWMLVLQDAQEQHIEGIFLRLREHLNKVVIKGVPQEAKLTFSLGAAELKGGDSSIEQLIKRADENLYKAKAAGRNQYVIGSSE